MAANWKYFRDEIIVNNDFNDFINASISGLSQGSTLLIAARSCQHEAGFAFKLPAGYNLTLVADTYDSAGGSIDVSGSSASGAGTKGAPGVTQSTDDIGKTGDTGGPGPAGSSGGTLKLFAKQLVKATLVSNGGTGGPGGPGGLGGVPARYVDKEQKGGFGFTGPGAGGDGGTGGAGGNGGAVVVVSVGNSTSPAPVQITSSGGLGGAGGIGGVGAIGNQGKTRGKTGASGARGAVGQPGQTSVTQVLEAQYVAGVLATLGTDATDWAQYRLLVGEYFFRGYHAVTPCDTWRGTALGELTAALELNPGLTQAQTDMNHLLYNRNLLGIARDVDVFPDFDRYESFVSAGALLMTSLGAFISNDLTAGVLSAEAGTTLQAQIETMQSSIGILQQEEQAAALDNQIAGQEKTDADKAVDDLNQQVIAAKEALDNASISFSDVVGVIGTVVKVVMAIPTGGASLLSFAPDIAALSNALSGDSDAAAAASTTAVKTNDTSPLVKAAGNLKNLITQNFAEVNNLINLTETIVNIGQATSAQEAAYKQLLAKSVAAVHTQLLAGLRSSQTGILQQVAVEKITQQTTDLQTAQSVLANITANTETFDAAAQAIITTSRSYFETVARFAFYAARALEIYCLADLSAKIRFDYGYVHPDVDQDFAYKRLTGAQYAAAYQAAWSNLPTVMDYRQQYLDYFANTPADFTRDIYQSQVTDAVTLAAFIQQRTLEFDIDLTDPALTGRAEAKAETVAVALIGPHGSTTFVDCLVEHSGVSTQRKVDGTLVTQYLRPHSTVVQIKFQALTPADLNANPTADPLTAPRSIAFWGRGVATRWRITISDANVDLSGLTEIQVGIGYTAFLA